MSIILHFYIPPNFSQSLERWIQHDSHHVVSLLRIKKLQTLLKKFDYFYHLQSYILVQKANLCFKQIKKFRLNRNKFVINHESTFK